MITKALIIADPWIGYLLDGTKIWEMRSSGAAHRGWFGLIRKGTGAIYGIARLVDVGLQLSPEEMIATYDRHRIPEAMIRSGEVAKWNIPWKLADVRRLPRPVPYTHKSGAVTWVELDGVAINGIAAQVGHTTSAPAAVAKPTTIGRAAPLPGRSSRSDEVRVDVVQRGSKLHIDIEWDDGEPQQTVSRPPAAVPASLALRAPESSSSKPADARAIGEVVISEGNIANNHIYLRSFFDRFPADVVGGSNKASIARRTVTIEWGGPEPVVTDLDGTKKLFRARSWIGAFFQRNRAAPGDTVIVEQIAPYRYRVALRKAQPHGRAA
jgi:hypothetical protein